MKVYVQDKPPRFVAEQFLVAKKPWPKGVKKDRKGGFTLVVNPAVSWDIKNGDWIIHRPGKTEIVSSLKGYDVTVE